ncbi:MAG: orotidine-5'-phosphate decarboxylase [Candidatus ainarchaeum sp.]|nr:orotidine-5'-phosphate decarboxylase [Candidatus ainarchaeum sp.]
MIDLERSARENKTILCFGVDPDMDRIASAMGKGKSVEETIAPFFHEIIDKLLAEKAIAAIKPNYAYFAQYGFDGLYALEEVMQRYRGKVPLILDGKRGDIGKSSEAYAKELYDFWGADATTISPYMGEDSVKPFLREGKLAYMLCRTSNSGAKDFEELKCGTDYLYERVATKALEWNCGLVVGATSEAIKKLAKTTKNRVPFLIPGVGAQGGDLGMVMEAIKENPRIHRINASSSIAYAYEKQGGKPADAALKEAEKLNSVIRRYLD